MATDDISVIDFDLDVQRNAAPQSRRNRDISAARVGKPKGSGIIEDNGVGISGMASRNITIESAYDRLRALFGAVRNQPAVNNKQVAATAATAITTLDGVVWRGAGDAPVVAIGENGRVIVLNKFHVVGGEMVANTLQPGNNGFADHVEAGHKTWAELERELGTKKIRIAVMSDGLSKSHDTASVAADIEHLIKSNRIDFNDPDWSSKLLKAGSDKGYHNYKSDDRVVVSSQRPFHPHEQSLIGAFDGVGSGGEGSARIARMAVKAARDEAHIISRAHPPLEWNAGEPMPKQQQGTRIFSEAQLRQAGAMGQDEIHIPVGTREEALAHQQALKQQGINASRGRYEGSQEYSVIVSRNDWERVQGATRGELPRKRVQAVTQPENHPFGQPIGHNEMGHPIYVVPNGDGAVIAINPDYRPELRAQQQQQLQQQRGAQQTPPVQVPEARPFVSWQLDSKSPDYHQRIADIRDLQGQKMRISPSGEIAVSGIHAKTGEKIHVVVNEADLKAISPATHHALYTSKTDARIATNINRAGMGLGVLGVATAQDPTERVIAGAQLATGAIGNLRMIQTLPGAAKFLPAALMATSGTLTIAQMRHAWDSMSAKDRAQMIGAGIIGSIPMVLGGAITAAITATFPPLAPFAAAITAGVGLVVGAVGAGIGGAVYEAGAGLTEAYNHHAKAFENFKQGNYSAGIGNVVDGLVAVPKTAFKSGLALVEGTVGSLAGMGATIVAGVPKLAGGALTIAGSVANYFGATNVGDTLKKWGDKLDGAGATVMNGFNSLQEGYTKAKEKLFDKVDAAYQGTKQVVSNVKDGVVQLVKDLPQDPAKAIGTAVTNTINGAVNVAKNVWGFITGSSTPAKPAQPEAARAAVPVPPPAIPRTDIAQGVVPRPVPMPQVSGPELVGNIANGNNFSAPFKVLKKADGIGQGMLGMQEPLRYMVELPDGRRAWMQDTGQQLMSYPPKTAVQMEFIDKQGKPVLGKDGRPIIEQHNIPSAQFDAAIGKFEGKPEKVAGRDGILDDLVHRPQMNIKIGGGVLTEAQKNRGHFAEMLGLQKDQIQLLPYRIQDMAGQFPGYAALLIGVEAVKPGSLARIRVADLKSGRLPEDIKRNFVDIGEAFGFGRQGISIKGETNVFQYLARRADDALPNIQNANVAAFIDAGQPKPTGQILTPEQQQQIAQSRAQAQKTASIAK